MVEEVTVWQEGRGFQVRIADAGPMPLKQGHADIRLTSVGSGKTRVVWGMDYQVKYGPIGWLMGQTMMKAMMTKVLDGNLKGLEQKARAA